MEDNKRKLYDALSAEYDLGTFEQFSTDIQDADKRKKLYDATINDYDFGDYDSFSSQLGFSPVQESTVPQQGIIPELLGVPYPAPEVDKSQYTFTGEQLGLEDHAESPENPVKSPEGNEYRYTGIGKDYKIEPSMKEQFGKEGLLNQSAEEYMTDVQKNIDSRKVGMDFEKLRQEQGINAGRSNVVKKEGRYYTEAGSFDNYSQAAYEADKHDLESDIKSMIDLYKNREGKEWENYERARNLGLAARGFKFDTPEGLKAADRLRGYLSVMPNEAIKALGKDGYEALKFYDNKIREFGEKDAEVRADAERLDKEGTVLQGFEGLGRGMEYLSGEMLNVFTGSALDDKEIIENWDEFFKDGKLKSPQEMGFRGANEMANRHINYAANFPPVYKDYQGYLAKLLQENDNDVEKVKGIIKERSKESTLGDWLKTDAAEAINDFKPTAKGVGGFLAEMIPNMAGTLLAIGVGALTKNPAAAKMVGYANLASMGASTAGNSMKEARDAGATNGQVWATGIADGAIEFITEKIPYDKLTGSMFRQGKKGMAAGLRRAVDTPEGQRELSNLLNLAQKELGVDIFNRATAKNYLSNVAAEGLSEFSAEALQTMTKAIYASPEEYPTLWEAVQNGWEGMKGGLFMGAVLGGYATVSEAGMHDARRRKQGFVRVAQAEIGGVPVIGEILEEKKDGSLVFMYNGEEKTIDKKDIKQEYEFTYDEFRTGELGNIVNNAYEEGYSQEPTGANALNAMTGYDIARQEVTRALGLAEDADVDAILNGRSAEEVALGDADVENAIVNYQMEKARKEGLQERFQQTRAKQYEESDRSIDKIANNGVVYSTTINGEQVYITGGTVVLDEQGFIDVNSSNNLFCLMPDGTKKPKSENELREKISMQNAEDLKAAKRAEINDRWRAEFDTAEAQAIEQQQIPTEELNRWKQEAGIQSTDTVADDTTDNVAPTGDNVAPVAPVEMPDVPDFFRLNGKNYEVASRNADGSVDVVIDGKRETLPAGTDYSTSMPTDKKGDVQYEQMPVERTHEHFVQKVTDDESRALMIEGRRKKAEAERKKFDKKPDPGLDPDKWAEVNRKWEEDKKVAQAKVDYWNEVAKREAEMTRSETREAVENIKPDVVKETAEEFIASHLPKITPESFKRETGLSNEEQSKLVGVISNEGVTIEQAAESIMENYDSELKALGFTGDMQDVRNVIIDVLSQGNPRSYAKNSREAREAENIEQQRTEAEAWAMGTFNMTLEELYVYEETLLPRLTREFEGFDEKEYYDNLAENHENDTTRESESIGRGGEVLQGEQSVPASGAPAVGVRNEGGAVSNNVQGGGQNGVAQEEAINEPVGNSEQLSSSEIPNNQSVAEGDAPGQSGVYADNQGNPVDADGSNSQENTQKSGEIVENGGEKQPRRKPRGFRSEVKKTTEELFAEEKEKAVNGVYSGDYAKVLAESNSTEEAISKFNDMADVALAQAEEWASRQYKKNNTVVTGQNPYSAADEYETTIGAANERRRDANIKRLNTEAETLRGYANTLAERTNYSPSTAEIRTNPTKNAGEIQEPRSVEEDLDNGDKRITNYNSRGEAATVAIERDGKVVSVDSYDEGVLFEHTEYDSKGKASLVTRYDKQGNVISTQRYVNGKRAIPTTPQEFADEAKARAEEKQNAKKGAEKIDDVGEKIGGARKDIIRQYADKIKLDGKTFSTMFPKPDIDKLVEAGLPKDKVATVKAMYDNAKREFEIAKKRRGKDKALQVSLFYAMYAKNVLTGEEGNFDLAYNGFAFTEWGKEFMKANIALYKAVFNKLGTDYGKVDLRSYFITPLAAGMRENFNLKKLNEENSRMQQRMAEMDGRKVPEYKDGDLINFVGEHYSRPSDQFETLEEAVNTMLERIGKEVKVGEAVQYKVESYWKRDAQGRADYTKAYLGIKVRGFGTVDVMEFKNMNEARAWLQDHREDFQQMAAAKEEQVRAEKKKPLPKYVLGHSYNEAQSQYSVFADFGKEGVRILKTFDIPQAEGVAAQAKVRSEVYKNEVLPYINSEEAVQSADGIAQEIRDAKNAKPKSITIEKKSRERVGVDWRNGKDATPEMFVDVEGKEPSVFGFRAIEFGNYVSQKERQQFLNDIYDALMDMSEILGVSPRALSLGGKLALAVGARGTSGASGHYEPYKNVINITKTRGAGVLAHEWLHALDRYFSNFDENMVYPNGTRYATQQEYADDTRQEVKDVFEKVMLAVKASDYRDRSMQLGEYWASENELAARALQDYVIRKLEERGQKNDFLSNHVAPEEWDGDAKDYPFPLGEDVVYIGDAFDNFFATLQEKTVDGQTVLYSIGEDYLLEEKGTEAFKRATKTTKEAMERLKANGLEVEVVSEEEANAVIELAEMQRRKSPETALPEDESSFKGTVISSDDGANILKDIDNAIAEYENKGNSAKTFIGDVARILRAVRHGSKSEYADIVTANGIPVRIRLADHNVKVLNYDNAGINNGISIVISRKPNEGITNNGDAHLVEFFYSDKKINKADGKPLVEILKSIKQALYSGEYKDNTGLAVREEVNIPEMMTVFHGSGAQFDRFDHAFMGTGEGAQAFGWGTYVTEVEGIGKQYAESMGGYEYVGNPNDTGMVVTKGLIADAQQVMRNHGGYDGVIERFKDGEPWGALGKAVGFIKNTRKEDWKSHNNLYSVEIPDDNGSNYLHWGEKINGEIQERVANGLQNIGFEIEPDMNHLAYSRDGKIAVLNINAKGKDLYAELSEVLGGDKQASLFLSDMGFVGISYPAEAMTGGRADGARNYVIFNENDAQIKDRVEFLRAANGKVYGWAVDGKIYLTPDGINPNSPVHEYTHLWAAAVEQRNPELWAEIKEAMKLSPVWNEVMSDGNYSNIWNNGNRVASEVLSRLTGRENYRRTMEQAKKEIEQAKTIEEKAEKISRRAKIKAALKNFWNRVQNIFRKKENATGPATKEMKPWDEFVNSAIGDFYKGKNPNEKDSPLEGMFIGEKGADNLDRTKGVINEFNRIHKGALPVRIVQNFDNWKDEFREFGVKEDEISRFEERIKEGSGRPKGAYLPDADIIVIFDHSLKGRDLEGVLWHENMHKAIREDNREGIPTLESALRKIFRDDFDATIKEAEEHGYIGEDAYEELACQLVQVAYLEDKMNANGIKGRGVFQDFINPLIKKVYGREGGDIYERVLGKSEGIYEEELSGRSLATPVEQRAGRESETETQATGGAEETRFRREVEEAIEQQEDNEVRLAKGTITSLGEKLNSPVKIIDDLESVPENRRKWKGWFDPKTGEVVVVMPNHVSTEDAVQTVLHETVAHKGLRAVLGEKFDEFLDGVYKDASQKVKRGINDKFLNALKNGSALTVREATEEYIAELAERDFEGYRDTWNAIRQWFRNFFRNFMNMEITDGELRYLLWKNYNRMKSGPIEIILDRAMEANTGTGKVMARTAETFSTVDSYNKNVKGFKNKVKEGWYDEMRSLKVAQEAIEKELGKELMDSENVYLYANHIPSINKNKKEVFDNKYLRPFTSLLKNLYEKEVNGKKLDEKAIERYTNAKHGIERNREMSVKNALTEVQDGKKVFNDNAYKSWAQERDEVRKKNLPWAEEQRELDRVARKYGAKIRDYSGLTAIFDKDRKMKYAQISDAAYQYVADVENALGKDVKELWGLLKGMTDYSLNEAFESGMMSKATYEHIKQMYKYYVPLRGFTEQTAEDFFDYVESDHSPLNAVVKTAYGRTSEADNIFATILNMANSAIVQGSKNRLKQRLLNLAMRSQTRLLSVDNAWYEKKGDTYEPVNYPDKADEYADFEERMKDKEKRGEVVRHRPGLDIGKTVAETWNKTQHAVRVKRNGREYVVWVNGDPRLANAVNGMLREEIGGAIKTVNQFRSKMVTQYSPTFVFTNLLRDVQSASIIYAVRRGTTMLKEFEKNVASNATDMIDLYLKHKRGTLDVNNPKERYFKEFLENGGETGYTEMISIEEYEKKLKELTTGLNMKNGTRRAFEAVGGAVDFANRCVENLSRFSAYQTSREAGISILKSIEDAKEVSVNFNRKGSGAMGQKYAKAGFMFLNPAVQSIAQRILLTKKYPKKMTAVWVGEFILGAAMPVLYSIISAALGDDDDEITGNYYNLSDYRRRSSLCLPLKDGVFHIPLSHESRVLFGLGELCTSFVMGHEKLEDVPIEALNTLAQSLPLNPVEGWMPGKNIIETMTYNFMPDAVKPIAEVVMNRDFAGNTVHNRTDFNEFMPEYMRGKRGTLGAYKKISKYLTSTDGYEKSFLNNLLGGALNPSVMEHLVEGYLGGPYTLVEKVAKAGAWAFGNEEYAEFRNIPIASSFYTSLAKYEDTPTEGRTRRDWENAFRFYKDEVKGYDDKEKTAKNGLKYGEEGADLVLEQMERNGEVLMVDIFNDGNDRLKELYGASDAARKNRDFKRVEDIDQQIYAEKRNIVSLMEQLADDPMVGYTFKRNKIEGPYGERETYGDVRDVNVINDFQKGLKPIIEEREKSADKDKYQKQYNLWRGLENAEEWISNRKSEMKKKPEKADELMTKIREKRAEAIELINNYRNNE